MSQAPKSGVPVLNWKEIALLSKRLTPELADMHVERVFARRHPDHPDGFARSEWVIQFASRRTERAFAFSVRSRSPYFSLPEANAVKPSPHATKSPFDLALSKYLRGARLLSIETPPRERALVLWFRSSSVGSDARLGLVILLIPAMPEALLVEAAPDAADGWKILARSRTLRDEAAVEFFSLPDGSRAPVDPVVRGEWAHDLAKWSAVVEAALKLEAFDLRLLIATRSLRELLKQASDRERQSLEAAANAEREADWQRYGDLLKGSLDSPPPLAGKIREVTDFESGHQVPVPCDPKLSLKDQVEKFYQHAKRKNRRLEEARNRARGFKEAREKFSVLLATSVPPADWKALARLELAAGTAPSLSSPGDGPAPKKPKNGKAWLGKTFQTRDGLQIFVGRSKDENLELTFKHARGNDLWMHVRGKPGAHLVIPLSPGKSAPLETLLDAAQLCLWYSGGEKWGKTEVDYAYKKYVKRIKDSTEASYTHNKTLMVAPEPVRLKRLLDQNG